MLHLPSFLMGLFQLLLFPGYVSSSEAVASLRRRWLPCREGCRCERGCQIWRDEKGYVM